MSNCSPCGANRPTADAGLSHPLPLCPCCLLQVVDTDQRVAELHANSEQFDSKAETSFKYLQVRTGCTARFSSCPHLRGGQEAQHGCTSNITCASTSRLPTQVCTACANAFAHGSNEVANSIGPLAAIYQVTRGPDGNRSAPDRMQDWHLSQLGCIRVWVVAQ